MQYLDENPDKRIALVKRLQIEHLRGVRQGKFMIDIINQHNKENGIDVEIRFEFDE